MQKGYNLYNLEPQFRQFLAAENISPISLKNYASDIRYFLGWMSSKKLAVEAIDKKTVEDYRDYLISNNLPHKTVNRRLSTLRKFCSFCISQGWLKENPAKKISNIIPGAASVAVALIENKASKSPNLFQRALGKVKEMTAIKPKAQTKTEEKAKNTPDSPDGYKFGLQHYIAFLIILIFMAILGAGIYNQFFAKPSPSIAYPATLTRAGRILSFQGRLTDSLGNPITTATNVTFKLYNVSTGGSPIYTGGACSITPDQDGIINVLVGGSGYSPAPPTSTYNAVCGSEIDSSVFTENANVYMGVTVAADAEMTPRQQIANVGYAMNSETLQGFPPGTGPSSIPFINSEGDVLIAAANPEINSSYASSTFTISSANATTIQSAGSGDITLQATESGTLKFRTGGDTDANNRLTISNAGDTSVNGDLYANSGISTFGTAVSAGTVEATQFCTGDGETNCVTDFSSITAGSNFWTVNAGSIYPSNSTLDAFIGGTASDSAKFAFLNVNNGTPTASVSGSLANVATFLTGNGSLSTTNRQDLILGNSSSFNSTGNTLLNPLGSGYVGIGTNAPGASLQVKSTATSLPAAIFAGGSAIGAQANSGQINIGDDPLYHGALQYDWGGGDLYIDNTYNSDNGAIRFRTETSGTPVDALSITGSGKVGIGTTVPSSKLDILNGNIGLSQDNFIGYPEAAGQAYTPYDASFNSFLNSTKGIYLNVDSDNNDADTQAFAIGKNKLDNNTTGELFRVNENGTVGIGDSTPDHTLDVAGNIGLNADSYINFGDTDGTSGYGFRDNSGTIEFKNSAGTWTGIGTGTGTGSSNWTIANGSIYPINETLDAFIGGTASDSAKFAFLNVNSGDPTASIAGNLAITSPSGADPATSYDVLNGGSFNLRTSVGGNTGLTSRLFVSNTGNVGIGDTTPTGLLTVGNGDLFTIDTTGRITKIDNVAHTIDDVSGNLTLTSNSSQITLNDNTSIVGTLTLPNTNTLTGVAGFTRFNNGIAVGGATTYKFDSSGNLFANNVSTGGTQRIDSGGNLTNIGSTQFNGVTYNWPGADGTSGSVLRTNGTGGLSWYDISSDGNVGPWTVANGSIYPDNSTLDLFIGGSASDSAKFAFLNVNAGDPTASMSGNLSLSSSLGASPFSNLNILNGGTFSINNSVGGDSGLLSNFFVDSRGYIGIGNDNPTEKLTIQRGYNTGDDVGNLLGVKDGNSTNLLLADGGEAIFKPTKFDAVFNYDGVATYNDDTAEAGTSGGTPFELLTAENPSNDHFYAGLNHKFETVYFDIVTPGAGVTMTAEYYNGSGWSPLTITDNTSNLTTDGTITFTAPADWAGSIVNGSGAYWIRLISTTQVTTAPTAYSVSPTTGNRFSVFAQNGDITNPSLYVNDIGNVGIGTDTPASKLSIGGSLSTISNTSGDITIDAASGNIAFNGDNLVNFGQLLGSLGSNTAPTYSFNGDTNTGFYSPGADTLALSTAGSERVRIDSSGNVGIGTNNPDLPLGFAAATGGKINLYDGLNYDLGVQTSEFQFIIPSADASSHFSFGKGNSASLTEIMRIQNDGKVGIGDTTPAATFTVGNGDKFQVDGATGNITTAGDLALNGGDLTSTGALTVTPNAGSNLNVALSTTGDFAVNTSMLYVDTSASNVGVGTATPNASYKLHVNGAILADEIVDTSSPGTWYLNPAGASALGGNVSMVGDLSLLDGSPMITTNNGGTYSKLILKGSNDSTTTSVCIEGTASGTACDGVLHVGTVGSGGGDFAEYFKANPSLLEGQIVSITDAKDKYVDLATEGNRHQMLGVIPTHPGFVGNAPEQADLSSSKIVGLIGQIDTYVSSENGQINVGDPITIGKVPGIGVKAKDAGMIIGRALEAYDNGNPSSSGKIRVFVNPGWFDPGIVLTSTGDYAIKTAGSPYVFNGNLNGDNNASIMETVAYQVVDKTGQVLDNVGSFAKVVVANIQAGLVETENLIVKNTAVIKNLMADKIVATQKVTSPVIETENAKVTNKLEADKIETSEIKPAEKDVIFDIGSKNNSQPGQLAQLIIKGLEGKTVTTIDAAGNATFSGQVVADSLSIENNATVSGTLTAGQFNSSEASVSGTLVAKEIQAENLTNIENRLNKTASDSSALASNVNDIQKLLADIQNTPTQAPEQQTNLSTTTDLSSMTLDNLTVSGNSNFYNVSVSNSISTGSLLIEGNKILSLGWDLNISALSNINFFDGAATIARDGTITTHGELIAEGGVRTDEIKSIDGNSNVNIDKLAVGALAINDKYMEATSSAAVIVAADNFQTNGLFAPAIETASSSAGIGILPSNSSEIVIYNENIREDSLVYLTPTSDYPQSGQLTVVKKETQGKPYFKVSSNAVSALPVKFNWLIVN